jgi:sugar/nucleoside kinase (ribokinase family)
LHFDYTTVGHVTIDVLPDGTRRAGGSAFYSALQAARLGLRTLILTQGVADEITSLIEPFTGGVDLEVQVLGAQATTRLQTSGLGHERKQRVLAWAGVMPDGLRVSSEILHLAPVARESPGAWTGSTGFVGLTPQGLARTWSPGGGEVTLAAVPPDLARVAGRCDAVALNVHETDACSGVIATARRAGALIAITAQDDPNRLLLPDGADVEVPVAELSRHVDDLGAGDVYAAALFTSLSEGEEPLQAALFANAASAVRMLGYGAGAIGDRASVQARMRSVAEQAG